MGRVRREKTLVVAASAQLKINWPTTPTQMVEQVGQWLQLPMAARAVRKHMACQTAESSLAGIMVQVWIFLLKFQLAASFNDSLIPTAESSLQEIGEYLRKKNLGKIDTRCVCESMCGQEHDLEFVQAIDRLGAVDANVQAFFNSSVDKKPKGESKSMKKKNKAAKSTKAVDSTAQLWALRKALRPFVGEILYTGWTLPKLRAKCFDLMRIEDDGSLDNRHVAELLGSYIPESRFEGKDISVPDLNEIYAKANKREKIDEPSKSAFYTWVEKLLFVRGVLLACFDGERDIKWLTVGELIRMDEAISPLPVEVMEDQCELAMRQLALIVFICEKLGWPFDLIGQKADDVMYSHHQMNKSTDDLG